MKIKNRVLCVLVAVILCIGVIPVMASAAGDDISQAFYFAETDKLQWSLVEGAAYYGLVLYESSDESDGTEVARLEPTTNYLEASEVIPYSGDFYFSVMALNASGWPMGMGKTSAVFSYTVSEIDTPTCTCTTRCYVDTIEESGCDVCGSSGNPSDCMGTPELVQNGGVYRLSDSTAEIGFMGSTNASVTWTYHYQVTATADEQPTAAEIISAGESGAYSDPMLLTVTDLSAGEKTIHMVLHQKEQERTTNVLRLTIPAYVPLTITPSAQGGNYDAKTNTLTIFGGTTVTFTTNEAGCGMGYKEGTTQGPELIFSGEEEYTRTAVFPSTLATYVVVAGIGGREAECTIVVKAAPSLPINGVSGGWSFIETTLLEFVRNMTTPPRIPVNMNGSTKVPSDVLNAISGQDAELTFRLDNGVDWTISGLDIPANMGDLNLDVEVGGNTIPTNVINSVTPNTPTIQLDLDHNGPFGAPLTLTVPVGMQNAGRLASLYYYNENEQLEFRQSASITAAGAASLLFTRASSYVVFITDTCTEAHTYENACDTDCNVCGAARTDAHQYTDIQKTDDEHWYECNICHAEKPGSRAAHEYGDNHLCVCGLEAEKTWVIVVIAVAAVVVLGGGVAVCWFAFKKKRMYRIRKR